MIELKEDKLWIYITVEKRWNGTRWNWTYQLGENPNENFAGTAATRRGAIREVRRHVKQVIKNTVVVQMKTKQFV